MKRNFVVGDIHGGLKALIQVLDRLPYSNTDRFIFLGDYVDGWSDNAPVVNYLMDFSKTQECIFLRGNHDELVHDYLSQKKESTMWLEHGGQASKNSYDQLSETELKKHIQFFENLHNYFIDEANNLFVHAGFTNQNGPQFEYYPNLVYWDRTLWEMVCTMNPKFQKKDKKYPKRLLLFNEIYIGHTPVTRIGKTTPVNFANVWNIDTGAAFKGPLTIIDSETKEFWQSDPVWKLYPDELGRN